MKSGTVPAGRRSSLIWRIALPVLYLIIISLPVLLLELFDGDAIPDDPIERIALDMLLIALPIIAFQPVLAARLRILDRNFGFNTIIVIHKVTGMTGALLLVSVPVLHAAGSGNWVSILGPGLPWYVAILVPASLAVLILVVTSFLIKEFHLKFETWRMLHNVLALTVLTLSFLHGFIIAESAVLRITVVLLFLAAVSAYTVHRILGPALRKRILWTVTQIRQETHNVWTLELKPPQAASRFDFVPGQFQFITLYRRGLPVEEHHFTISSDPAAAEYVASTIKESGDFTATIGRTKSGDTAAVQAPFGNFSCEFHPEEKDLVFVAGGIGITPFMSMLRFMRSSGRDVKVLLLYANSTENDIVFRRELDAIASGGHPALEVVHVLSDPGPAWKGEHGRIDREVLKKFIRGDMKEKAFYFCGPPSMMTDLVTVAYELGVPPGRIHSERFSL